MSVKLTNSSQVFGVNILESSASTSARGLSLWCEEVLG